MHAEVHVDSVGVKLGARLKFTEQMKSEHRYCVPEKANIGHMHDREGGGVSVHATRRLCSPDACCKL